MQCVSRYNAARLVAIEGELVCSILFETYVWHGFSAWPNNSSFVTFADLMTTLCGHFGLWPFSTFSVAILVWFVAVLDVILNKGLK